MSAGKLPEGWATAPVSTVTTLIRGVTYKKEQALNYLQDDYLPLIRANNIQNGKFDTTDLVFVPKNLVKESQKISPEDIVIAMSSGSKSVVGKSAHQRLPFECSFGAFCGALRPEKLISPNFIAHFTKSSFYRNKISSLSAGANINNIKPASFDLINIPIPSLAEQKIIAEKLDTLQAQVDSTKTRLEQIPQILKRFRQAVLAAAVSGELTKHLTQTKKNEVTLDKIATIIDPHPSHRTPKIDDAGIPYIGIGDIQPDGKINFTSARKVSVDVFIEHRARYTLNEGDFIFGKIGTLGKACVLPIGIKYTLSANVILIQPIKDKVSSDYLRYFLSSPLTMQEITQQANSTSQAAFGIKKMRAFKCNLPSLVEQHEIVRRVEQLFAYADTIEKQVNSALTRVNSLTQSILAKAFRGELTAQWRAENPDLISGENSAAALLEKIKAERAASGGKKTSRKKA